MSEAARVVLVKPGDVLVFGNLGETDPETVGVLLSTIKNSLGLAHVVAFEADIDIAMVPGGGA